MVESDPFSGALYMVMVGQQFKSLDCVQLESVASSTFVTFEYYRSGIRVRRSLTIKKDVILLFRFHT